MQFRFFDCSLCIYSFVRRNLQSTTVSIAVNTIMRWANDRSIWFMTSEIIERKYIFLCTDIETTTCRMQARMCARLFFFFSVFSAVRDDSREKIDIPGYAQGESLELVSFGRADFDLCARRITRIVSLEIIFIWLVRTFTFGI